jgi:hypothetical protein
MKEQQQNSTYPLRLPEGLRKVVAEIAKEDGTSMNQFITLAVAEKISALKTAAYFEDRAKRANMQEFWQLLNRDGGEPPRSGDELPTGYVSLKNRENGSSTPLS